MQGLLVLYQKLIVFCTEGNRPAVLVSKLHAISLWGRTLCPMSSSTCFLGEIVIGLHRALEIEDVRAEIFPYFPLLKRFA